MFEQSLFTVSGYVDETTLVEYVDPSINFFDLPPILRVLMSSDGTVTKTLESFFWEPVRVNNQKQVKLADGQWPADYLVKASKHCLLSRYVHLEGMHSRRLFARAQTYIDTQLLPLSVSSRLDKGDIGVGEIIRQSGMETYREIKRIGCNDAGTELWRCYRILFKHQAVMQITEFFPISLYR